MKWRVRLLAALTVCGLLAGCGGRTSSGKDGEGSSVTVLIPELETNEVSSAPEEPWRTDYKNFLTDLCAREAAVRNINRPDYDPNSYPAEVGALSDSYALYGIDKDSVPEMLLRFGDCKAAYHTQIYTFRDGRVVLAGDVPSGHSSFYTWPDENAVALNWGHMGGHLVEKLSLVDGMLAQETGDPGRPGCGLYRHG